MQEKKFKKSALYLFKLIKSFILELFEPKVSFYAASMSWSTLFFMIPLLVIVLSVIIYTPMFSQFYTKIHTLIANSLLPGSSKVIMDWIDKFVANAYTMGYIGIAYIIVAAVMFFRDFDYIVNDIFDDNRRTFLQSLKVYATLLIAVPLLISITIWVATILNGKLHLTPYIIQFILIWLTIFTVYKVAPKESIPTKIVAISSFIATFTWFIAKSLFVLYIYYSKTYTTIYGTISIVLFLFLWIYISWTIFLHGLQLCSVLHSQKDE